MNAIFLNSYNATVSLSAKLMPTPLDALLSSTVAIPPPTSVSTIIGHSLSCGSDFLCISNKEVSLLKMNVVNTYTANATSWAVKILEKSGQASL